MTRPPKGLLLVGAAALAFAAAAPARATTLAEAIAYAYETNPGLQSQRAALRGLDEGYVQARSQYGLQIGANVSSTNYDLKVGASPGNFGQTNPAAEVATVTDNESVSLVQPLWTGGRVKQRVSQAEASIRQGREQLRRAELDLLNRVVSAYVSVRRDEQLLRINEDTITALGRQVADTEARFKAAGIVTRTDIAQAQARLAQARSTLAAVQGQLAVSRAQYLASVGQNPVDLQPPPDVATLPATIDAAFNAAEANNPQLLQAVYAEQGSRARVAEAKAGKLPTVNARLDFGRSPLIIYQGGPTVDTRVGTITLNQPLFTSGQLSSVIRQATEENTRDRLAIDETRLQVTQQVSQAWEQLAASRKQLATYQDEVTADEFAFYGVRQEEKFALRSTIEVLNAELELTNAQQNLVRVRAQEYAGRVQLLATVGVLEPRLFAANVTRYDPTANFKRVRNLGATPLEIPVRILDGLLSPQVGAQPPASIAVAHPGGAVLPAPPAADAPMTSILSALDRPPSFPREPRSTPPDPRTPPTVAVDTPRPK